MTVKERRERERACRHQLIIESARDLAEAEGWDEVTTRRLAERIEYSQPVLYSHFAGKEAIVQAVALQGFGELAAALRNARAGGGEPEDVLRRMASAYADFGLNQPRVYDAMFVLSSGLIFGSPETPEPLQDAFSELRGVVADLAQGHDIDTYTEVVWSALHGLVTLARSDRLRGNRHNERLDLLLDRFTRVQNRSPR